MIRPVAPRDVVLVVYPGIQTLDLIGPVEVFAAADDEVGGGAYRTTIAARDVADATVTSSSGVRLAIDAPLASLRRPIDTLVVVGGKGTEAAVGDELLVAEVHRLASLATRVTSVCSGAFLLGEAGLLDGRRATTHWQYCALLARRYPSVTVEPDPIFVRDGTVITSAGVTAGMDLALALVEDDLGHDVALAVARRLVLFLRRPGNQSQFSTHLVTQLADRDALRELQSWIAEHPAADLTVAALARQAGLSERHLARVFRDEVGVTPARYVERIRLEVARRRLEESNDPIDVVAAHCGFGTTETMRRSFLRALRTTPSEYRRRFRSGAA